jgi:HEAT repeat protein
MEDENDEVRNWATFQLGLSSIEDGSNRLSNLDSDAIRDAFRKRLDDSFADVREEAIWGLALRKDQAGLRLLSERLDSDPHAAGDEMAAAEILDQDYDTPLEELRVGLRCLIHGRTSV